MKTITEEYEEITKEYEEKMKILKHKATQPIDPLVLTAWKAAIKRKLFIIWTLYVLIVGTLAYFALWVGNWQWNAPVLLFFGWPLLCIFPSLFILRIFIQLHRVIKKGTQSWWYILKNGAPLGKFRVNPDYDITDASKPEYWIWSSDD